MWQGTQLLLLLALGLFEPSFSETVKTHNITIGYLPCLKGTFRGRQGLTISGAISMALDEINNKTDLLPDVRLLMQWGDTRCNMLTATRMLIDMINLGVVAFFGPEGTCSTEAIIAESKNLPMMSHRCSDHHSLQLSTFVRLEPQQPQVMKYVISLLKYYRWNKFSILYEESWNTGAQTLVDYAKINNMTVNHQYLVIDSLDCCEKKLECCSNHYWYRIIKNTKSKTRIYVYLGSTSGLIDMMNAMEIQELFTKGEYMVIFVDMMSFSPNNSLKYFIGKTYWHINKKDDGMRGIWIRNIAELQFLDAKSKYLDNDNFRKRGQSLFVLAPPEPSSSFGSFKTGVQTFNHKPPFDFPRTIFQDQYISIYAAYLYDLVKLYAIALHNLIQNETQSEVLTHDKLMNIAKNGSLIASEIKKMSPFKSISGMSIRLDERGESEGTFSLLAFKPSNLTNFGMNYDYAMTPVGHFLQIGRVFPEYKLHPRSPIDWADSIKPEDEPTCGFFNEKC